jgi:hypothetical protein
VLYFYRNTVVSKRTRSIALFRVSTADETVECHGNILHVTSKGKHLSLMCKEGLLKLGRNWLTDGWVPTVDDFKGEIKTLEPLVTGADPGFVDLAANDFSLRSDSPCGGAAPALPVDLPPCVQRYVRHQKLEALPAGTPANLGAW